MAAQAPPGEVGVVGLGTMGGQIAGHLIAAGYQVVGRDIEPDRAGALAALGGACAESAADVARRADTVLLSLPSVRAFEDVVRGTDGVAAAARPGLTVIEASTLPLAVKEDARQLLEVRGPVMLDEAYAAASMRVRTFQKDLDIISGFARDLGCPTPLFGAAAQVHLAALAQGHGDDDTASVFAVLRRLAGRQRE